jgi:hypothetical protein
MTLVYDRDSITYDDSLYGEIYITPLSVNFISFVESLGGKVKENHLLPENGIETNQKFHYTISFPTTKYSYSIIKGGGSYGRDKDLFELAVLCDDHCCYDTDITDDVIGYLEEEDLYAMVRLLLRLDEDGHIRPLTAIESSQNEQLA